MTLFKALVQLSKLRIVSMVLVTSAIGTFLASRGTMDWIGLGWSLLGTGLAAAGAAALNNYLERELDARMERTRHRVLPSGQLDPAHALSYGVLTILGGVTLLVIQVNLLTGFLVLLTAFLYVIVYTPLKRWTWLNTSIGAIPGALPAMSGWAAASGDLGAGAWILFAILFLWQHPHFYAIAWMYRKDYAAAGYKMLSVIDPTGRRMFRHTLLHAVLLIGAAATLTFIGLAGWLYFTGSLAVGLLVLWASWQLFRSHTMRDARKLLRASIYYLPVLLVLIAMDVTW